MQYIAEALKAVYAASSMHLCCTGGTCTVGNKCVIWVAVGVLTCLHGYQGNAATCALFSWVDAMMLLALVLVMGRMKSLELRAA